VINRLANLGRIVGLAAGAAVVSGAAVLVTASAAGYSLPFMTPSSQGAGASTASLLELPGATPSALCSDFVSHFSADLNKSQADVNAAFQKAIGETLADEVKNGKLTQKQADAIKKRLAGRAPCAIAGTLKPPRGKLAGFRPALLSAAASALGITDQALKADLGKGMTLSQIAAAQKVTEAQFRSRLIAKLTPVLDAAVTNKKLTTAQEQAIIKRLQTGPIPLWNKPVRPGKAAATPTPTSANT
jgi:hypothetical protein